MRFFTSVILLCVGLVAASPFDDAVLVSRFTFNFNNYSLLLIYDHQHLGKTRLRQ
jgi:hypothetical protein